MYGDAHPLQYANGGVDANTRGIEMAKKVLADYEEPKLDDAVLAELDDYRDRMKAEIPENSL